METYNSHLEIGKITIEKLYDMEKLMTSYLLRMLSNIKQTFLYLFNRHKNKIEKEDILLFEARILEIQKSIEKSKKIQDLVLETYNAYRRAENQEEIK
jgi:hypothetical protein